MLFRMKLKLKFIHNESRQHYTLSALDLEVLDLGVCMQLIKGIFLIKLSFKLSVHIRA